MSPRFVKPDPQAVTSYAASLGYKLDGEAFCDYYESKGWLVGKSPMKCWQAAVRTWKRNATSVQLFNPAAENARARAAKKEQLVDEEERYLKEKGEELMALKSWRGAKDSPWGDIEEKISRHLSACRDKFGAAFVAKLLETYGRRTPVQPIAESTNKTGAA